MISDVSSEEDQPQRVPTLSLSTPPPMETLEAAPEVTEQNPPLIASLEATADPVIPSLLDLQSWPLMLGHLTLPTPLNQCCNQTRYAMKFARRVHSNTTLKGGEGRMEIEYLKNN